MAEENIIKEIKELIFKADELQLERFQAMTLVFLTLLEKIIKELKNSNGNLNNAIKEVDSLKQTLAIFNLNNLRDEN